MVSILKVRMNPRNIFGMMAGLTVRVDATSKLMAILLGCILGYFECFLRVKSHMKS